VVAKGGVSVEPRVVDDERATRLGSVRGVAHGAAEALASLRDTGRRRFLGSRPSTCDIPRACCRALRVNGSVLMAGRLTSRGLG
jgi:hypothetical protein